MIEWIKYDPNSRDIESHVTCLVTDGRDVRLAQHAKLRDGVGYGWHPNNGGYRYMGVTHWAKINLPVEGFVTEGKYAYQRLTRIKPVLHYYGDDYIKYGCPICEALGNRHQITRDSAQCTQCNVNLIWEGLGDECI